jgi:hypothetical protein
MIDYTAVSREFRSLVSRRRELQTFLGSVFAALGIFLQNVLQGNLPPALGTLQAHGFAFYATCLLVPSLVVALRFARLHGGLMINGILYARLMQDQTFTRRGDPQRSARHNFFGVSFLQFVLVDLIAGFSAAILALALAAPLWLAVAIGIAIVLGWLGLYARFFRQAVRFALHKIATDSTAPFDKNEWQEHVAGSLEQANHGLLGELAFTGLIVFSVFETLSGLGGIKPNATEELTSEQIQAYGPLVYSSLMLVTCLLELVIYIRVRVAIGNFSLQLDPTDRPFRPLRLTDSLLGYMLLAFLFALSVHMVLILLVPVLEQNWQVLLGIDVAAFVLAILAEQVTLVVAGRYYEAPA